MILRIEESRSGEVSPRKSVIHVGPPRAPTAADRDRARTNLAAVEMAVVLIVVALVMVAIILSSGCSNRLPQDLSAAHTSPYTSQVRQSQPAQATPSYLTTGDQRFEDAKRNARESEVSDLSVGS